MLMYGLRTWEEVRRLYSEEHKSARQIARELGISRNTVRRLLDLPQPPRYRRKPRESLLDPYRDIIAHLLHKNPFMPARAILDQLRSLGYKGSISSLRNYLASARFKEPTYHQQGDYHAGVTGAGKAAKGGSGDFPQALQEALVGCADTECGMNLISPDFDILMVNRTNERLFQKPMTEFLGRKCYEEFEKRQEVCSPSC
jgi:DNA-binding transcriptional MerR regulator